jgi:zinc-ribbon domain
MIVCCPSCSTRYNLPSLASGAVMLTCRSCGHRWREMETIDAIDISEAPVRHLPAVIDHDDAPDLEASRLAQLARDAQEAHQLQKAKRRRKLQQWAVFGSIVLAPFVGAAAMPETIVNAAPISIKAYQALGYDINVYGLEVRSVEREHIIMDGQRILAIKGVIANVDSSARKIPWLRFALSGPSGEELYSWTLDTGSKPVLRPGESTSFVTRISAPPEASQNLQIRFARMSEISLNTRHDTEKSRQP